MKFDCDCCGCCCRSLKKVPALAKYDRGDGVCVYLRNDNLCDIYDHRPEICNVDLMYERYFSSVYTREDFYAMNKKICNSLRSVKNRAGFK